jgi:hypothetical protein
VPAQELRPPRDENPRKSSNGIVHASGQTMSEPRKLRVYAYVNKPYAAVRQLLQSRASEVFPRATTSAVTRAGEVDAQLRVSAGGVDVGVDVRIHLGSLREEEGPKGMSPITRVPITWEAVRAAALFPSMTAELSAWPLTATETQIELEGAYRPPLGAVGNALDAAVGHRVAEAAVHRFLDDVVEQMRRDA